MKQTMSGSAYDNKLRPGYYENNYARMAAAFVVETERWDQAASLLATPTAVTSSSSAAPPTTAHGGHGGSKPTESAGMNIRSSNSGQGQIAFVRNLAAAARGSMKAAPAPPDAKVDAPDERSGVIFEFEVAAVVASMNQDHERAAALMKEATIREERMGAPSGPPELIKPSHELFGEILLRAGKPEAAAEQFKIALLRQPNRARSLLGAARAAAKIGDQRGAMSAYARLLEQWRDADQGLAELAEAQNFLKQARF
jgi:tetratricopeptide (TPR) repeat protein